MMKTTSALYGVSMRLSRYRNPLSQATTNVLFQVSLLLYNLELSPLARPKALLLTIYTPLS